MFAGERDAAPMSGGGGPAFADRVAAGRALAAAITPPDPPAVVVGLARGGVVVAAEVAAAHHLPLDAVAVRKIGHPADPEYALGAATPDGGVYLRASDGLPPEAVERVVAAAEERARLLDARLHAARPAVPLEGAVCLLVDDGLATGATMLAAVRWARARGARRVVAAAPVGPDSTAAMVRAEADEVVLVHEVRRLWSVGGWYRHFEQVDDEVVLGLLAGAAARGAAEV